MVVDADELFVSFLLSAFVPPDDVVVVVVADVRSSRSICFCSASAPFSTDLAVDRDALACHSGLRIVASK